MDEDERRQEAMTDEDRAWMESDLSHLSGFEPYEWAGGELEAGEPVRYVPGVGAVAGGEDWVPHAEDHEPAKQRVREIPVDGAARGRESG